MRLFISYVQGDYSIAQTIVNILRYSGHDLWFGHRLLQGSDWRTASREAIEWCDVLVILLSPKSVESAWCMWEWTEALTLDKPVVPVLIEACQMPTMFQDIEYMDFSRGNILAAVAQLLGGLHSGFPITNGDSSHLYDMADHGQSARSFQAALSSSSIEVEHPSDEFENDSLVPESDDFTSVDESTKGRIEYGDIVPDDRPVLKNDPIFGDDPLFGLPAPQPDPPARTSAHIPLPPTLPEIDAAKDSERYTFPYEPETIRIPGGTFMMGNPLDEESLSPATETPQLEVTVAEFYIGKYPVTIGEFWAFIDEGGYFEQRFWTDAGWDWRSERTVSQPKFWDDEKWSGNERLPVIGVSWYEAIAYTRWLAEITGRLYRLPAESEWEFAARGTDGRLYPWGDTWYPGLCNVGGAGMWRTTSVGYYSPGGDSPFGVADMSGNVWEWCLTKWRDRYTEPEDNELSGETIRCLRGGSWFSPRQDARVTSRIPGNPGDADDHLGFRVVCGALPLKQDWPVSD